MVAIYAVLRSSNSPWSFCMHHCEFLLSPSLNFLLSILILTLEIVTSDRCRIIGIFMELTSFESNACYNLSSIENERSHVKLEGTRIDVRESFLDFDLFLMNIESIGFHLQFKLRIDCKVSLLTDNERRLNNMFWSFEFSRGY